MKPVQLRSSEHPDNPQRSKYSLSFYLSSHFKYRLAPTSPPQSAPATRAFCRLVSSKSHRCFQVELVMAAHRLTLTGFTLSLSVVLCLLCSAQAGLFCRGSTCFDNLDDLAEFNSHHEETDDPAEKVCFSDLGCFYKNEGQLGFLHTLPDKPSWINATFTLFSKDMPNGTVVNYKDPATYLNLSFLHLRPEWLTIIVHGFGSGPGAEWLHRLKDIVFNDIGGYVMVVDWSRGADFPHYYKAAANTELVGRMLARLIHRLLRVYSSGLSASRVHFIGHSLGAQMGHFFSMFLHEISGLKPARLTALDAAGPAFEANGVFVNRNDADFVEGLHTSGGGSIIAGELGMMEPFGHVDFYPNGGQRQPGCSSFNYGCSHTRAHELYVESRSKSKCRFISYPCAGGLAQYASKKCIPEHDKWSELGLNTMQTPGRGVQFFETSGKTPFCEDQVKCHGRALPLVFFR